MNRAPAVGAILHSDRLGPCKVTRVLPAGTVEVMARSGLYYRVSGLPVSQKPVRGSALDVGPL